MLIQWNLSVEDTSGTQLTVLYREVSLIQGYLVHSPMWLGQQTLSSLQRMSLIQSVLYRKTLLYAFLSYLCIILCTYCTCIHLCRL